MKNNALKKITRTAAGRRTGISVSPNFRTVNTALLVVLFGFLIVSPATALDVPALQGRVNDHADILSQSTQQELESYLAGVEDAVGAQIAVLTIPSLGGEDLESYSLQVSETWELGQKGSDNGALLLVAMAERKVRIEVGYGLEGTLTDAMSGYIIRETIVPEFKRGNYEAGIAAGVKAMGGLVTGDVTVTPRQVEKSGSGGNEGAPLFIILFILFFLLSRLGGYRRYRRRGMSPGTALLMGMMLGGGRSRSSGGFGGSSSGGFGGGFSGGGGGFGGGGASGGW